VRAVRVGSANGAITLEAQTAARGDPSVAIWAARRNSDLLAEAIGRPVEIETPA
jgi:hypothetical protein